MLKFEQWCTCRQQEVWQHAQISACRNPEQVQTALRTHMVVIAAMAWAVMGKVLLLASRAAVHTWWW